MTTNPAGRASLHLAIPLLISIVTQNRQPCSSPSFPYLAGNNTIRVLDRQFSTTGLIVIAENVAAPYRYMRCDHSLLGGRWQLSSDPSQPLALGESIFLTFTLQEAVRLVERPQTGKQPRVLSMYVERVYLVTARRANSCFPV